MPELPEVQTVVTTLAPKVTGRTIRAVTRLRPDIVTPAGADLSRALAARRIDAIARRGKRIVFTLDDGNRFYVHLGMTGQLTVTTPDTPVPPHTHMVLALEGEDGGSRMEDGAGAPGASSLLHPPSSLSPSRLEVRFRDPRRFGGVWWLGRSGLPDAGMGPEPLKLRPAQLFRRLHRTTRAVKNALLDQSVVAGLGNIYVDEALFAAGIHPLTAGSDLTPAQVGKLNRAIKTTLRRALRHRGSTLRDYMDADGAAGSFQNLHRVYDRAGQPCRRCRTPVERIVLGGRSTHFCPRCQGVL
jgi:formamidopyrimidine-DNA glycosylase